ncbi:MAG: hypothetical protein HC904_16555 [Blastochloris sp.]|nr:hypothetical protein [Blastochloris sp.]
MGSDDEINQLLGEQGDRRRVDQEVVFVRDDENPDKIDFYTVFDEVGEIEVKSFWSE